MCKLNAIPSLLGHCCGVGDSPKAIVTAFCEANSMPLRLQKCTNPLFTFGESAYALHCENKFSLYSH